MIETTLKIQGMMCPHCESQVTETIKGGFNVKKVVSSHENGTTVITSKNKIERTALEKTITALGFKLLDVTEKEIEKKGIFSFFAKK